MSDYISRDVAKAFFTPQKGVTFLTPIPVTVETLLSAIDNIPAADVRPVVSASWEEKEKDGVWWYACSACGEHIPKGRWGQEWYSNFCPNCGARMDGD